MATFGTTAESLRRRAAVKVGWVNRRTVALGTAVLVTIAAGTLLTESLPSATDALQAPFVVTAAPGEPATLRTGEVIVTDVSLATTVVGGLQSRTTTEVFLIVTYDFTPAREESSVTATITDGSGNSLGGMFGGGLSHCVPTNPGQTTSCAAVVEVAEDAVAGSSIRLRPGSSEFGDSVVVVDLQLAEDALPPVAPSLTLDEVS